MRVPARDGVVGERARPGLGLRGARRLQQFPGVGVGHAEGAGEVGQDGPGASPGPQLGVFLRGAGSRGDSGQHRGSPPSAVVRGLRGARGPGRAGRAEDRVAADQQGLGGGEDEGRDFRPAGHGGLVQAVAAVDQQRRRLAAGVGQGGEDDRLVGVGGHGVVRAEVRAGADQGDGVPPAVGVAGQPVGACPGFDRDRHGRARRGAQQHAREGDVEHPGPQHEPLLRLAGPGPGRHAAAPAAVGGRHAAPASSVPSCSRRPRSSGLSAPGAASAGWAARRNWRGFSLATSASPSLTRVSRALAIAPELWSSTLWISCGVNSPPGWATRWASTLSRSPPGRTAGAFRPPIAAFSARRAWAACSAISSRPASTRLQVPARGQDQLGCVGGGLDLVEALGQVRDQGRVRRIAGLAAGVRRGVLVVRGVVVGPGRCPARPRSSGSSGTASSWSASAGGVVRLGLRRLRARRWPASAASPASAGSSAGLRYRRPSRPRRHASGLPAGSSPGWPACPASGSAAGLVPSGAGPARVQVSGMPGLPPLTRVAVPAFSISSRAARAAGLPVPAASAMTATVLPGLAASAA